MNDGPVRDDPAAAAADPADGASAGRTGAAAASSGAPVLVADGVLRIPLASDTLPPFETTNAWLIGASDQAALVDPGFRDPADVDRIREAMASLGARDVKMILLTHTHPDHVAGLDAALDAFGSPPVYVHPIEAPRVAALGNGGGRGAGGDAGDGAGRARAGAGQVGSRQVGSRQVRPLQGDRRLMLAGRVVHAVHTPGHAPGHLAFHLPDVRGVLAGDLLTARGSTWVGLPEGDAGAYLTSLDAVEALAPAWIGVGHGPEVGPPVAALQRARRQRATRANEIEAALDRPLGLDGLREAVYPDVPEEARRLIDGSLLAHLARLMATMRVVHLGDGPDGPYRRRV